MGAAGNSMDKDSDGQRKLKVSGGRPLPEAEGHILE